MIDFPNNPVDGDRWTDTNNVEWEFEGYGWKEFKPPLLSSMTDVSNNTPNVGDRLVWDGTEWVPQLTQVKFSELTDVVGTPVPNDYMIYDGTNWVMRGSSGGTPHIAKLRTTNGISVTRNAWVYPTFTTAVYDTGNMINPSNMDRITITEAGLYTINWGLYYHQTEWMTSSGDYLIRFYIFPSGSSSYYYKDSKGSWTYADESGGFFSFSKTLTINMNVGDNIRYQIYFGSSKIIQNINSSMSVHRVSETI